MTNSSLLIVQLFTYICNDTQFFIKQLPCQHEKWLYNTLYNIKHYLLSQKRDVKMVVFTNRSRENATKKV
ncbi:hypothetical protein [Listeria monocytogenes]|uniref:hypothetical protein n=1 Tax=Listeria monocytogenes TaxID=1639 RepID=UPI001EE0C931|nr:hypothetical protein [Listeria monocytogenes]MCG3305959.1 hypothetical protein [Listeria monocytogenes]